MSLQTERVRRNVAKAKSASVAAHDEVRKVPSSRAGLSAAKHYRSILATATRVWGDEADAAEWLSHGHPELQDAAPISLLGTESGRQVVKNLLASLEFGFSV